MRFSESKVRYFLDDDIIDPIPRSDGKPYKAYLVKGKNKEFWIPKSTVKNTKIVDRDTGEIIDGYYVKEWWRNRNPEVKTIRMSKTDYSELPAKYLMI